ncbi:MAG: FadR family transcriptional regulator [Deltaproteobacteria bacterium]|nr:FadR family transcriptional regulator [Deltaproteobacteria bacterium]
MKPIFPFRPLKKKRLYEEVADQIKQAIYDGQISPGDRLPSEREFSQLFGVGRPTIREALRTLSVMGLIEINPGFKGAVVKDIDITRYMEAVREQLAWLINTDEHTLKELWEVRKYIELGIAHAVAANATKKEIHELEQLIKEMKACTDDIEAYFHLAVEFHQRLALMSRNKIFFIIWEMFHDVLLRGYMPILKDIFPDGPDKLLEANLVLVKAIKSGDPEAIEKAMEFHVREEKFFPHHFHKTDKKE